VDTLVGFFGINEKPSSSKDPFALRRAAITLLKIILENKIEVKLSDLLKNSVQLYREQKINLTNENLIEEILLFLKERTKNLLKDKGVRPDIIEAVMSSHRSDNFLALYQKGLALNKHCKSEFYKNMVASFKRASNILNQEKSDNKKLIGQPDSILFKTEEEKELYEKINEIKKHFLIRSRKEDYEETIKYLSSTVSITNSFFENVIVNDDNADIKENRLELLKMFCQTFNIFIDFSKLEGV
jgi:glycyl-tRNA synthetase beta chain